MLPVERLRDEPPEDDLLEDDPLDDFDRLDPLPPLLALLPLVEPRLRDWRLDDERDLA